jgi:hypothetical protein
MADRKAFPLRLDPATYEALQRWAGADLRSLNAQIEFLLRKALQDAGRVPTDQGLPGPLRGPRPTEDEPVERKRRP